jgi:hypothetical protein
VGVPARTNPAGGGFEVSRAGAPVPAETIQAGTSALDQVRSGHIDLATYLDRKVNEATAHLTALPASQLDAIRGALRDRFAADPSLVELVTAATGQAPPPRDD